MKNGFNNHRDREKEPLSGEWDNAIGEMAAAQDDALTEGYEHLAGEVTRVLMEESPRLAPSVQARQLAQIRAQALQKRRAVHTGPRWDFAWFLRAMPRWIQVAAIAVIVVLVANGITVASASSLPGSPLYLVKRLAEQSNLFLSPNAGQRARVWMNLASIRLDEAQRVLANGQRVDPAILDAVDQSIFNALAEIAGTRGAERVDLLKQITQLAMRQQLVLDELAPKASPTDRARFEQTSRLLGGVATLAGAAESNPSLPLVPAVAPTATETPTVKPTATPPSTWTPPPPPVVVANPAPAQPSVSATPVPEVQTSNGESSDTAAPKEKDSSNSQNTQNQESEQSNVPGPVKTQAPERNKTSASKPDKTEAPERSNTAAPEHRRTATSESH